jgi:hypothetical protein
MDTGDGNKGAQKSKHWDDGENRRKAQALLRCVERWRGTRFSGKQLVRDSGIIAAFAAKPKPAHPPEQVVRRPGKPRLFDSGELVLSMNLGEWLFFSEGCHACLAFLDDDEAKTVQGTRPIIKTTAKRRSEAMGLSAKGRKRWRRRLLRWPHSWAGSGEVLPRRERTWPSCGDACAMRANARNHRSPQHEWPR